MAFVASLRTSVLAWRCLNFTSLKLSTVYVATTWGKPCDTQYHNFCTSSVPVKKSRHICVFTVTSSRRMKECNRAILLALTVLFDGSEIDKPTDV
jgi:hypothetical protein